MQEKIIKLLEGCSGKIGFYYKDLNTQNEIKYNEDVKFMAASIVKLPILIEALRRLESKDISDLEKIAITKYMKVPSCGALTYMHDGIEVTIRDLCNLMIILSDNTATNVLIDRLGIDEINKTIKNLGLKNTILSRKMYDMESKKLGNENYFSLSDMAIILESIHNETLISQSVSKEIKTIMKEQQINHKIPYYIPEDVTILHKTGEADGITHDIGIVYSKNPFIIGFASNETNTQEFEDIIIKISRFIYEESEK